MTFNAWSGLNEQIGTPARITCTRSNRIIYKFWDGDTIVGQGAMSFMRGDLLTRVGQLVKGGVMKAPRWLNAVKTYGSKVIPPMSTVALYDSHEWPAAIHEVCLKSYSVPCHLKTKHSVIDR